VGISKAEVEWKHYNPGNKLSMLSEDGRKNVDDVYGCGGMFTN
jgi:hypothetical protein